MVVIFQSALVCSGGCVYVCILCQRCGVYGVFRERMFGMMMVVWWFFFQLLLLSLHKPVTFQAVAYSVCHCVCVFVHIHSTWVVLLLLYLYYMSQPVMVKLNFLFARCSFVFAV